MTKVDKGNPISKFETMGRDELLRLVLIQEDELERFRPKPAKFRLGQVLKASPTALRPQYPGQPGTFFIALSVELHNGKWYYGYSKKNAMGGFLTMPESRLEALTEDEIKGGVAPVDPTPMQASAPAMQPSGIVGELAGSMIAMDENF